MFYRFISEPAFRAEIKGEQGPQGPQGIQGIQGETGNSGVHYGHDAPTDPEVLIWIDTTDPVVVERAEDNEY